MDPAKAYRLQMLCQSVAIRVLLRRANVSSIELHTAFAKETASMQPIAGSLSQADINFCQTILSAMGDGDPYGSPQ